MRISYKTLLLPSFLILGGVYTALTSSSNPPLGHTGSPGESNCTSCHGGTALNSGPATRSLLLNGSVPTAYVPGQTYNVSLTVNRATRVKFGFQLKVEDGNGSDAGTLISTTNRTDLASGYLGQTWNGNTATTSGTITWNFQWTAPAAGTGDVTFYYCSNAANNNGGTSGDEIYTNNLTLTEQSPAFSVSGVLHYDNSALTPIINSQVRLLGPGGVQVATATTNASGQYLLNNVAPGSYTLTAQSSRSWGGVSASDALQISRHFSSLINLTGLRLGAADVNATNSINTGDALLATRRYSGNITSFGAGDWRFESIPLTISASSVTQNVRGICYGDVNGSFLPSVQRTIPYALDGEVPGSWGNEDVLVPIVLAESARLGSLSLDLQIPDGWQGAGVESYLSGMLPDYRWNGNRLRLAWFDTHGWEGRKGAVLLTLRLRPLGGSSGPIVLMPESEWTDPQGQPLEGLRLVAKTQKSDPSPFLLSRVAGVLNTVRIQTSTPAVLRCWDATGRMLSIEPLEGNTGMESMERQVPMGTFLVSLHPAMEGPKPMILKLGAF